jgi:lysozyme
MDVALSEKGAEFIMAWEGFRANCYDDGGKPGVGNCTIGIGHLVHQGPTTKADIDRWGTITLAHAIAQAQADAHLNGVVAIQQNIKVDLTPAQVDSLICLCFNTGPGALGAGHDLTNAVNSKPKAFEATAMKDWHDRVRAAFLEWAKPTVLQRRRESEAHLFATGKYTKAEGNTFANA